MLHEFGFRVRVSLSPVVSRVTGLRGIGFRDLGHPKT